MPTFQPSDRELRSRCYDGHEIVSPWAGQRFTTREQWDQAVFHRERVLRHLDRLGLRRITNRWEDAA